MSVSRLAAGTVALCIVGGGLVALRNGWTSDGPFSSGDTAPQSVIHPGASTNAGTADDFAHEPDAANRAARPGHAPQQGAPPRPTARSPAGEAGNDALGIRWRSTTVNQAAAHRRDEVVRNMPEPQRRNDGSPHTDEDTTAREGLPKGTRFAAKLNGNTTAVDGSEPIVEKNTDHDGNDGIYFPPDAQLAYPNRAGVQGDSGTVALWVEPVDWVGKDATVHSFFRLNDPREGGYRFHLLKDSASLRFQFITEYGESNIRVPIDWWPRGEGHHVAATWGENVLRLYVDGVPLGEQSYKGTLQVPAHVPGWWGSMNEAGTAGAGAVLRETLVTGHPLDDAEIERLWKDN